MKKEKKKKLLRKTRRSPIGSRPGELSVANSTQNLEIKSLVYNKNSFEQKSFTSLQDILKSISSGDLHWFHLDKELSASELALLVELGVHSLVLEDILNNHQRPKYDQFDDFDYIVTKMIGSSSIDPLQLNIIIKNNFVFSITRDQSFLFELIKKRILDKNSRIKRLPIGYLAYILIDISIDTFFPVIDQMANRMDDFEDKIMNENKSSLIHEIHEQKNELVMYRKIVFSHRELLSQLQKTSGGYFPDELDVFLRDGYDHILQQLDSIETYRDVGSNMMDLSLSLSSHQSNEIMKFLTVTASIFIPLTFLAGIYGMNFNPESSPYNMPELSAKYGYPILMISMLLVAVLMVLYFKKRGWFR